MEKYQQSLLHHLTFTYHILIGAKTSSNLLRKILNPFPRIFISTLSLPTTPSPDLESYRILAKHVEELVVEEYFFGWMFLASGSFVPGKGQTKKSDINMYFAKKV